MQFTTRPEIQGTVGVAASTHWIASQTAMGVLERGGNAFDAAVTAGFALQVLEPHLNGPGGDCPILAHRAGSGSVEVIAGQGPAPKAATLEALRAFDVPLIPGAGLLPAVVPGAFDAWATLLLRHGGWTLPQVLEPVIHYAGSGVPVTNGVSLAIERVAPFLTEHWPESAKLWLPGGAAPRPGTLHRNPVLAETYTRLSDIAAGAGGREAGIEAARVAWSDGFVAERIDAFCRKTEVMDASGAVRPALLRGEDLAGWRAGIEAPQSIDYRGVTLFKPGFWSQGPVFLQQLRLLEYYDLAALDPVGPDFIHLVVEAGKLAFADREAFYGDPDAVPVPADILLSSAYAAERRALIGDAASLELRPGAIDGYGGPVQTVDPALYGGALGRLSAGAGEPTTPREDESAGRGDTCHLDVVDRHGDMVSATPSGGWLQGSPLIPELGFALGTRLQMVWLVEDHPSALRPGVRPRSTLSPSMALRDGQGWLAFGSPGGDRQDQWPLVMLLRHLNHGMTLQAAIDAPGFHSDHFPSSFWPRFHALGSLTVEERLPEATVAELRRRGHQVEVGPPWSEGRVSAAGRRGDILVAAANPRGMQGYAVGR